MVLNVTNIYPDYNRVAEKPVHRPAFGNNQSGLSPAIRDDLGSVTGGLKSVRDKLDRFERGSRDVQTERVMDCAEGALFAGGIIPTIRRLNSIPQNLEEDNWKRPLGLAAVTALSLPGDWRELRGAASEIYNKIFKNQNINNIRGQHKLTLLSGTFLEKLTDKSPRLERILGRLSVFDKTLYDTGVGKFFGIEKPKMTINYIGGTVLKAYNFEGGFFKRLAGNALLRTPIIGLGLAAALEMPAIVDSACVDGSFMDKIKSFSNQVCKSAAFIGTVQGGISLAGAAAFMLFPAMGVTASLVGMALGSAAGVMLSGVIKEKIDKLFS